MTFSYNAVWNDTIGLLKGRAALLVAIAGAFIFLPMLLIGHFFPPPESHPGADARELLRLFVAHYRAHSLWYVLQSFLAMTGTASMLRLVFADKDTVGGAVLYGARVLGAYSVLTLLVNAIVLLAVGVLVLPGLSLLTLVLPIETPALGLLASVAALILALPGLFLWGRLYPATAAMVAEDRRGPIIVLKRSLALTQGRGWSVLGLYALIMICGSILIVAVQWGVGSIFIAAAGQDLGKLLGAIVVCALASALATLLTMLSAAIYRALVAGGSKA